MDDQALQLARREQSKAELDRLMAEIRAWLDWRNQKDVDERGNYLGRHQTRLRVLEQVLCDAAETLEQNLYLVDVGSERDTGEIYQQCREIDQAIVWLQRVFQYFQEKFDQRDVDRLGPLLEAADEVIWSCYREVYARAEERVTGVKQGPPPLPFIAAEYSPAAWESEREAPSELQPSMDVPGLEEFLRSLPVPVLRLPPWCVNASWWLVYIGHEMGHHLQYSLNLVERFRVGVAAIAQASKFPQGLVDYWALWSEEIFADVFSVLMMGPYAVRAMLEAERSSETVMTRRRKLYPPAVVRLSLMAKTAIALELDISDALPGMSLTRLGEMAAKSQQAAQDMTIVDEVVAYSLSAWDVNLGKLEDLCGFSATKRAFQEDASVAQWTETLLAGPSIPTRTLILPRILASAALGAWQEIINRKVQAEQRFVALDNIHHSLIQTLRVSGPLAPRAGQIGESAMRQPGPELARLLLRASRKNDH